MAAELHRGDRGRATPSVAHLLFRDRAASERGHHPAVILQFVFIRPVRYLMGTAVGHRRERSRRDHGRGPQAATARPAPDSTSIDLGEPMPSTQIEVPPPEPAQSRTSILGQPERSGLPRQRRRTPPPRLGRARTHRRNQRPQKCLRQRGPQRQRRLRLRRRRRTQRRPRTPRRPESPRRPRKYRRRGPSLPRRRSKR